MALFGMTARQWQEKNSDKKGNIRDYASINELICRTDCRWIISIRQTSQVKSNRHFTNESLK